MKVSSFSRAGIFGMFFFCVLSAGCVRQAPAPSPAGAASAPAEDAFALALSRMHAGEQAVMPTPFGTEGLVLLEGDYTSGLGELCRRATVRAGGALHRIAVCRDDSGWYVAAPVFEHTQR